MRHLDHPGFGSSSQEIALYFPHIHVPRSQWFNQVLLYWDRSAAIVPSQYWNSERHTDPYMQELHTVGAVEFVDPSEAIFDSLDVYKEGFLDLIKRVETPPEQLRTYTEIHIEKFNYEVLGVLQELGLVDNDLSKYPRPVQRLGPSGRWCMVESTVAGMYMAYLASFICGSRAGFVPVTDQVKYLDELATPHGFARESRYSVLRQGYISHALPAPIGPIDPKALVAFKERFAPALRRCRVYLDNQLAELATIEDPDLRKIRGLWLLQGIEDEIEEIRYEMKRKRWPGIAMTGFCGVGAVGVGSATALLGSGSALLQGLGVGAAVLGSVPMLRDGLRELQSPRFDHRRAPLAYAAMASEVFK